MLRYRNDHDVIFNDLTTVADNFQCELAGINHLLVMVNGAWALFPPNGVGGFATASSDNGTYSVDAKVITFGSALTGFSEATTETEFELDELMTFRSDTFELCHNVGASPEQGIEERTTFDCPRINNGINEVSELNTFTLVEDGSVLWSNEADDPVGTRIVVGTYVVDEGRVHMGFGSFFEYQRYLSADLAPDASSISIDELSPETGLCTKRP